jgi:DNA-binding XRE family transcriptional regulator
LGAGLGHWPGGCNLARLCSLRVAPIHSESTRFYARCNGEEAFSPESQERFGDAVRARREELELTQEDLAGLAKIHRTYLSDVERGTRNLSLVNIELLAAALSLPISELFQRVEAL